LTKSWFSDVEQTETSKLQEEFGLPNKFILYPAATWIHKNHSVLFRALEHLKSKGMEIPLICTGNKTDYFKILCKEMESMDIKSQVKFLGLVSEADLIGLYKMASLVVIPTLYEAGSGPLFEAMRYRVPVICARTTSLPETIANDEFVFDPKDSERLAQLIEKGLFDAGFINENLNNSRTRIEYYSKFDYKKSFIDTFNQTISDF
jgi:glycosyltransferase involved in cell wall biosynthesis